MRAYVFVGGRTFFVLGKRVRSETDRDPVFFWSTYCCLLSGVLDGTSENLTLVASSGGTTKRGICASETFIYGATDKPEWISINTLLVEESSEVQLPPPRGVPMLSSTKRDHQIQLSLKLRRNGIRCGKRHHNRGNQRQSIRIPPGMRVTSKNRANGTRSYEMAKRANPSTATANIERR